MIARSMDSAADPLALVDTRNFRDGLYEARLSVTDNLELEGSVVVLFDIDNEFPFRADTSPKDISIEGGDVRSEDDSLHVYFPPRFFFPDGQRVEIGPLKHLATDGDSVVASFDLKWADRATTKTALLEVRLPPPPPGQPYSLWHADPNSAPALSGGAWNADSLRFESAITAPGTYVLLRGARAASVAAPTSGLRFTSRVFYPERAGSSHRTHVVFSAPGSARATVRVYNRAGRLVRVLLNGAQVAAGSQLVEWDGRTNDGDLVPSGLYIVALDLGGQHDTATVAVSR
jgi:hypothetical protein